MIARTDSPAGCRRFRRACRGLPGLGALMGLEQSLLGRSQPGRFYAGPSLALDIGGRDALAAGGANPEELASFLRFCGCGSLITNGTAPAGWRRAGQLYCFGLADGAALAEPPADEALWSRLAFTAEPASGEVAAFLFGGAAPWRDDFYSALCTKRSRGLARVWALTQGGRIVCTVGGYALFGGEAYMACGRTAEGLRGRGVGGRLIVRLASALAAEGLRVRLVCRPERAAFYARLGFAPVGALARYTANE